MFPNYLLQQLFNFPRFKNILRQSSISMTPTWILKHLRAESIPSSVNAFEKVLVVSFFLPLFRHCSPSVLTRLLVSELSFSPPEGDRTLVSEISLISKAMWHDLLVSKLCLNSEK